jgi:MFS family permease
VRPSGFARLWFAQTVSEFGNWMGAVPLVAILVLDASPAQMGLLESARVLPALLIGLYAGVWVDRLRRRPLLIWADLGRFVLLVLAVVLALDGALALSGLCAIVLLAGALTVIFDVAYRSYLPSLVGPGELVRANSKLSASASVAEVASPSIGGALAQMFSATFALLVDALSFLVSALSLLAIPADETERASRRGEGVRAEIVFGLRFLWTTRELRGLMSALSVQFLFGGFFAALYALYVLKVIGLGPLYLGVLVGAGGVGALGGAAITDRLTRRFGVGRVMIGALIFGIPFAALVPLAAVFEARNAFVLLLVHQLVGDIAFAVFLIVQVSVRQALTPDETLGRVNASYEFVVGGVGVLGMLTGGMLGETLGVLPALAIAVAGFTIPCVVLAASPVRTLRTLD